MLSWPNLSDSLLCRWLGLFSQCHVGSVLPLPLRRRDPTACEIAVGSRSRMESDPVLQCDLITIFPW